HRSNSTFAGNSGRGAQIASTLGNTLIIGSVVSLFGYIMYTLYEDLLADDGVTRVYNESLDLVRANPQIRELFGASAVGFGQTTSSRRHRQRTITHHKSVDAKGRQRLFVEYYVTDSKRSSPCIGVVKADLSQSKGTGAWDYNYIIVDVHQPADNMKVSGATQSDAGESFWSQLHNSKPIGRIEVLVTDEFAREIKLADSQRRNQRFSTVGKGTPDGSWFSVLHPSTWRK
ncbi:TIM21, partial [Coemansia guatemalensis]